MSEEIVTETPEKTRKTRAARPRREAWSLVKYLMANKLSPHDISLKLGGRVSARTVYRWATNGSGPQQQSDYDSLMAAVKDVEAVVTTPFAEFCEKLPAPPAPSPRGEAQGGEDAADLESVRGLARDIRAAISAGRLDLVEGLMQKLDDILDQKPQLEDELPVEKE